MKRYIVLDEPYGGKGIIGSVDSLDDIPYPNVVGEVIDTTIGKVYEYTGEKMAKILNCPIGWEINENIPDGIETEEEVSRYSGQGLSGIPYWVDMVNGSDDNDGLDISTPLETLNAALELSNANPERCKICVLGAHIEEFRV